MRSDIEIVLAVVQNATPGRDIRRKAKPRNESVDSAMIAAATSIVPATITGPSELGRMCRTTWRGTEAPSARAASTSFSRSEKNCARTRRPPASSGSIRSRTRSAGRRRLQAEHRLKPIAEQVDQQQQQRQLRQRQKQIVSHISAASMLPRAIPAMAPITTPTMIAINIAAKPTASEMRPP